MSENPTTDGPDALDVPVSRERLAECRDSAYFWVNALPEYADRNQSKAEFWSILAGVLAAAASLAIFPVLGDGSGTLEKTIVSVVALASAVSALVPRVKNYGELAGTARVLAAQYGSVYGRLLDLIEDARSNQPAAKTAVAEFNSIKEKKDGLRLLTPWIRKRNAEKKNRDGSKQETKSKSVHGLAAGQPTTRQRAGALSPRFRRRRVGRLLVNRVPGMSRLWFIEGTPARTDGDSQWQSAAP